MRLLHALPVLLGLGLPAMADPARIVATEASESGGLWRFDVTVAHADTGWEDYADGWRVELADGTILETRVLAHPHVDEQPFTRSLFDVAIPDGTDTVHIRASTNVTGWAEETTIHALD